MGRDLAIDLGTANTLVYRQGDGIVFDQPTVVALHGGTGEVLGMGDEVWDLIGGDSGSVVAVRPLRAGAMTEFDITQRMLELVVKRSIATRFPKPRVLVAVPSMSSEVLDRALIPELLMQLDRPREATTWLESMSEYGFDDLPFLAPADMQLGRMSERDSLLKARVHYRRVLRLWDDADPELRGIVNEAARRLKWIDSAGRDRPE